MAQLKKDETNRMEKILQHDLLQQQRNIEQSEQARQKIRSKNEETEKLILYTIQSQDLEARQFNEQQKKETESKIKSMQDKFKDLKLREEELKKKTVMIESIRTYQGLFRKYADGVCKMLQSLDEASYPSFGADKNQTSQLIKNYDTVIKNINAGILTENEVSIAQQVSKQIEDLYNQMLENIKKINEEVVATQKAKEQNAQAVVQEQQPVAEVAAKDTVDTPAAQLVPQTISSQVSDQLSTFVSPASLQMYEQIKSYYEQYQKQVKPLLDSEPMKKFRFNCQKAINIPVNAISAVSQQHLIVSGNKQTQK
jgi:nucleoporin GLE1